MYTILPLSSAVRQVFTIDMAPDGIPLHARIELRYLPAPAISCRCCIHLICSPARKLSPAWPTIG